MRKVRAQVPDQTVPDDAPDAGQEKVPVVLQTVPAHQQPGEPRARAHGRKTVRVHRVRQIIRSGRQPAHTRPHPLRRHAVRVRCVSQTVHANGQLDRAQVHPFGGQAVRVRTLHAIVLSTLSTRQTPEEKTLYSYRRHHHHHYYCHYFRVTIKKIVPKTTLRREKIKRD